MSLQRRYEAVPYPGGVYRYTHPDRMAVVAALRGLDPPPPRRILELGCGAGLNTVAIAASLPGAEVIGVDLSEEILGPGRAAAADLGLSNLRLLPGSVDGLPDLGLFDYVIAHGVYSWVPRGVQIALLDTVAAALTPDGLGYVSYNTLPGWHLQRYARDLMRLVGDDAPPEEAAALLAVASELDPGEGLHAALIREAADELCGQPAGYLMHDTLAPYNEPVYFRDFCDRLSQRGLWWVGEARPGEHRAFALPAALGQRVDALPDELEREQFLDFLRGRRFRRSVVGHVPPDHPAPGDALAGLYAVLRAAPRQGELPLEAGVTATFVTHDGLDVGIADPAIKRALATLWHHHPSPVPCAELLSGPPELAPALVHLFELEVIDLLPRPVPVAAAPGTRPCGVGLARWQAARGERSVVNAFHESATLGGLERQVLLLADGTRDLDALVEALTGAVLAGRLGAWQGDEAVVDVEAVGAALSRQVPDALDGLRQLSLLVS